MRERPILFSGPMVRALLAGTKTQTRRVVKPIRPLRGDVTRWWMLEDGRWEPIGHVEGTSLVQARGYVQPCPYGVVGDRLWVRESFKTSVFTCDEERQEGDHVCSVHCSQTYVYYAATPRVGFRAKPDGERIRYLDESTPLTDWYQRGWKPSIHMPRWASRIMLEITGVRVERLQDISEEDAEAEGVEPDFGNAYTCAGRDYRRTFERLWDTINGKRAPWSSNPWIWALTFRRLTT